MCTNGWHLKIDAIKIKQIFIFFMMFTFVCAIEVYYKLCMVENLWSWVFEGSMNPKPLHIH